VEVWHRPKAREGIDDWGKARGNGGVARRRASVTRDVGRVAVSAGRAIALVFGLTVMGLGFSAVRIGKVRTKTVRPPWPGYFYREKEPVAFWMTVFLWIALGAFIVVTVFLAKEHV